MVKKQRISVHNRQSFTNQISNLVNQKTSFAFKEMNIYELNKHKQGLLNIYHQNKRISTGILFC